MLVELAEQQRRRFRHEETKKQKGRKRGEDKIDLTGRQDVGRMHLPMCDYCP